MRMSYDMFEKCVVCEKMQHKNMLTEVLPGVWVCRESTKGNCWDVINYAIETHENDDATDE